MINQISNADLNLSEQALSTYIQQQLEQCGYLLVTDDPVFCGDVEGAKAKFLAVSEAIGRTVSHDENNSIFWDIKKRTQGVGLVQTYSEHNDEALLHTDSQYRDNPEDYMGLLTITPASCGGGRSLLLRLETLLADICQSEDAWILEVLQREQYPFVVPTVFNQHAGDAREYVYGAILTDHTIRFRIDTLEKALDHAPHQLSPRGIDAFFILKRYICESPAVINLMLQKGDVLFTNNKTTLHGRTSFEDTQRHLVRIRMMRFD